MEWLQSNLALLSGVLVPLLLGVVRPLMGREPGGAGLRRIKRHAQLRALLPEEGDAAREIDRLLDAETKRFVERGLKRVRKKLEVGTLVMIAVISVVGGILSFLLVSWAQSATGFWAVVLWALSGGWTLFILLLVLVGGLPQLYKSKDEESAK